MTNTQVELLKAAISEIFYPSWLENKLETREDLLGHPTTKWIRGHDCASEVGDILSRLLYHPDIQGQCFKLFNINPRFRVLGIKFHQQDRVLIWILFFYRSTLFTVGRYTVLEDTDGKGYGSVIFQHKGHHTATTIRYSMLIKQVLLESTCDTVFNMNVTKGSLTYNLYYPKVTVPFLSVSNVKGIRIDYQIQVKKVDDFYQATVTEKEETYRYSVIPNIIPLMYSPIPLIEGFLSK